MSLFKTAIFDVLGEHGNTPISLYALRRNVYERLEESGKEHSRKWPRMVLNAVNNLVVEGLIESPRRLVYVSRTSIEDQRTIRKSHRVRTKRMAAQQIHLDSQRAGKGLQRNNDGSNARFQKLNNQIKALEQRNSELQNSLDVLNI